MFMRVLVLFTIIGAFLTPSTVATSASSSDAARSTSSIQLSQRIQDQYIVAVKEGRDARAVANTAGVMPKHVYSRVLNGFVATLNDGQRIALERHPDVAYIEQDQIVEATGTQTIDPASGLWGLDRIDQRALPLSGSYNYTPTGAGVTAYIIDSGLQTNHPDFGTRAKAVYDAFGASGMDYHGHGTHLAGIIGGTTHGVAKQINLRGVRVLQSDALGLISDLVRGIDWVADNAVKPAVATIAIVPANMSSGDSTALREAITRLIDSGVFVAVSVGNGNVDGCAVAPANITAAFTAAASTRTDTRYSGSNYGTCVDGYAPGAGITSTWITSTTNTLSGTSQATAFVAGAAALYKDLFGDQSQSAVNGWLTTNATPNLTVNGTPNRLLYTSTKAIDAGGSHSCGLRSEGAILCWGRNNYGQSTQQPGVFTQHSAGIDHTCGLRPNQTLECWGLNTYGQATAPAGHFDHVSAGLHHSCAVRTDRYMACWGRNQYGQSSPPVGQYIQAGAGVEHSCALGRDTLVACWGRNDFGQTTVPSGSFAFISVGSSHNCGIRTTQSITCWGRNDDGQATPPTGSFISVSSGRDHSCGIRTNGMLACWGNNDFGESSPPSGVFSQISAGTGHTCGLRFSDSAFICWGYNAYGEATPPPSS